MTQRSLILGTAGHIDHGKTSLVHALTGVDTDSLAEEKRRGITIELGFTSFEPEPGQVFGIVDVPGHEGFVRTMLAGATGMDVVLMVIAADEGVMPQTQEHLDIIQLLRVPQLVVALTKSDLVESDWMELVKEDVRQHLADAPYRDAPIIPTSTKTGEGLETLKEALLEVGGQARARANRDLFRLPIDRSFTVEGTGTVVTGTLWSGTLKLGETVRVLPGDLTARVRGLQVHGEAVSEALAGQRTAVALTGTAVKKGQAERSAFLVKNAGWAESHMLTVSLEALPSTHWLVEHNQRVRVHLGTAEVMARVALFEEEPLSPGDQGLAQLRLESPVVARAGDRLVVRSYSPVSTIGGGAVLEPSPPKRRRLSPQDRAWLLGVTTSPESALAAVVGLAGWGGIDGDLIPVVVPPEFLNAAADLLAGREHEGVSRIGDRLFDSTIVKAARSRILGGVEAYHTAHPLDSGAPLTTLRRQLPDDAHPSLADGLIQELVEAGILIARADRVRLTEFQVVFTSDQRRLLEDLRDLFKSRGLQAPSLGEVPDLFPQAQDLDAVLRWMLDEEELVSLGGAFLVSKEALDGAVEAVRDTMGGREQLGPADFREVLPVTRRHLMPLLSFLDDLGVTVRDGQDRRVPNRD